MTEDAEFKKLIGDCFLKMGLSAVVTVIVLPFFFWNEFFGDSGTPLYIGLIAVHAISLALIFLSQKNGLPNLAMVAMGLGVFWNLAAIVYLSQFIGDRFVNTEALGKEVAGSIFLIWWFGKTLYKFYKLEKST